MTAREDTGLIDGIREGYSELRDVHFKLLGLTYLIENQGSPEVVPFDQADAHYGIGLILGELTGEVRSVSNRLEELVMKSERGSET